MDNTFDIDVVAQKDYLLKIADLLAKEPVEKIDAHIHLQRFDGNIITKNGQSSPSLEQVIKNAQANGVTKFVCNATCEDDWQKVIEIAKKYKGVYVSLGIHPWYMHTLKPDWDKRLDKILEKNPDFCVGEIGVDKSRPDLWTQENVFCTQLTLAHKHNRPVSIHCGIYKGQSCWNIVKDIFAKQKKAGLMPEKILSHSHYGDTNLMRFLAKEYNAYFSFSGIALWEKCVKVRKCLKAVVEEFPNRLLFESDGPDLSPEPKSVLQVMALAWQMMQQMEQERIKQTPVSKVAEEKMCKECQLVSTHEFCKTVVNTFEDFIQCQRTV